jgi:hypothetical protein
VATGCRQASHASTAAITITKKPAIVASWASTSSSEAAGTDWWTTTMMTTARCIANYRAGALRSEAGLSRFLAREPRDLSLRLGGGIPPVMQPTQAGLQNFTPSDYPTTRRRLEMRGDSVAWREPIAGTVRLSLARSPAIVDITNAENSLVSRVSYINGVLGPEPQTAIVSLASR